MFYLYKELYKLYTLFTLYSIEPFRWDLYKMATLGLKGVTMFDFKQQEEQYTRQ